MAATNGVIKFRATDDDASFTVDTYIPDAVATNYTFNNVGLAASTSTSYWTAPEDCILEEFAEGTAPTAVGGVITFNGAPLPNATFRHSAVLATLATRLKFKIFVPKGTQVGVLQF